VKPRSLLLPPALTFIVWGSLGEAAPAPPDVDHYVVQPGDSWSRIARSECGCTVAQLAAMNGTDWRTDFLHPGRVLHITHGGGSSFIPGRYTA
jgi:LysM repeat protein